MAAGRQSQLACLQGHCSARVLVVYDISDGFRLGLHEIGRSRRACRFFVDHLDVGRHQLCARGTASSAHAGTCARGLHALAGRERTIDLPGAERRGQQATACPPSADDSAAERQQAAILRLFLAHGFTREFVDL